MYALYDTETDQFITVDDTWVWTNQRTPKIKFNWYARGFGSAPFTKQKRVVIKEVTFSAS